MLTIALFFSITNASASQKVVSYDSIPQPETLLALPKGSVDISDSTQIESKTVSQQEAKPAKTIKDENAKESLGYQAGFQMGSCRFIDPAHNHNYSFV